MQHWDYAPYGVESGGSPSRRGPIFFGSGASNWLKLALFSHFFVFVAHFWFSSLILAFSIDLFSFFSIFLWFVLDFGKVSGGVFDDF